MFLCLSLLTYTYALTQHVRPLLRHTEISFSAPIVLTRPDIEQAMRDCYPRKNCIRCPKLYALLPKDVSKEGLQRWVAVNAAPCPECNLRCVSQDHLAYAKVVEKVRINALKAAKKRLILRRFCLAGVSAGIGMFIGDMCQEFLSSYPPV